MTLIEYRDKEATEIRSKCYMNEKDIENGYRKGFDAAIALGLPAKFAEWKDKLPFA